MDYRFEYKRVIDPGAEFIVELLTADIVIEVIEVITDADIHKMFSEGIRNGLGRGETLTMLAAFLEMPMITVALAIDRHNSAKAPKGWEVAGG